MAYLHRENFSMIKWKREIVGKQSPKQILVLLILICTNLIKSNYKIILVMLKKYLLDRPCEERYLFSPTTV